MIPFIFVITIVMWLILIVAFIIESYPLGALSSVGVMVIGVHILISGVVGISNTITLFLGTIFICLGFYIFIMGSMEQLKEYNYGGIGKW